MLAVHGPAGQQRAAGLTRPANGLVPGCIKISVPAVAAVQAAGCVSCGLVAGGGFCGAAEGSSGCGVVAAAGWCGGAAEGSSSCGVPTGVGWCGVGCLGLREGAGFGGCAGSGGMSR